ncbi:MAG: lysylphosphatidylglycerol synthase transmembrane domain-containing protein [Anaerolineae bacterium]
MMPAPSDDRASAMAAQESAAQSRSKPWLNVLKVVVSAGLLVLVITQADLRAVWHLVAGAQMGALAAAFVVVQLGVVLRAGRWMALMRGQGDHTPYGTLLYLYYVGAFFNTFLPTGFGGDAIRIYELSQDGGTPRAAISTVVAERALGLLVQFAMALLLLPLAWRLIPQEVALLLLVFVLGAFVGTALFMSRKLYAWMADHLPLVGRLLRHPKIVALYGSFHGYSPRSVRQAAGISVLFNVTLILNQWLLARALGIGLGVLEFAVFTPILSTLLLVPITIGGLGVREGGYVLLYGQAGIPQDQALALSLLTYATTLASGLIGGVLYVVVGLRRMRGRPRNAG